MPSNVGMCYLLVVLLTIALIVWGFMDVLKKKQASEPDTLAVISRQIRGFGMLMLASVSLIVGLALCFGASGGVDATLRQVAAQF